MILIIIAIVKNITAITNATCPISIVYKNKLDRISKNRIKNILSNLIKIPEEITHRGFLLECWRANQLIL